MGLTRREFLFATGASIILEACSSVLTSPSGIETPTIAPERSVNPRLERETSLTPIVLGSWKAKLQQKDLYNSLFGRARLISYKELPDGGITIAWELLYASVSKQVEIQKGVKVTFGQETQLTLADRANEIEWQGESNIIYIWKNALLKGDQLGQWSPWRDGKDAFSCKIKQKNVQCVDSTDGRGTGSNWPSTGGLYQMVYGGIG